MEKKTHCKYGHELTEENTYTRVNDKKVERTCRTCKRNFRKIYKATHKTDEIYRLKHNARSMLFYYIKIGRIKREKCFCGETKVHAHHPDYSKPLEVKWLCRKHHVEEHVKENDK